MFEDKCASSTSSFSSSLSSSSISPSLSFSSSISISSSLNKSLNEKNYESSQRSSQIVSSLIQNIEQKMNTNRCCKSTDVIMPSSQEKIKKHNDDLLKYSSIIVTPRHTRQENKIQYQNEFNSMDI